MKYKITYCNEFEEPYFYKKGNEPYNHLSYEQWTVQSKREALDIVKDFLDVPETELTLEQVSADFSDENDEMPHQKLMSIQNYYNGRLAMWNAIRQELLGIEFSDADAGRVFKYDIPEKYNRFEVDDETADETKQIQAFIKIEIA